MASRLRGTVSVSRQFSDECGRLEKLFADVIETCITVAEDLQDSGHVGHVDGVEQHLKEIAKLDHDVELLKSALTHTEGVASASSAPQDEEQQEPPHLWLEFEAQLTSLHESDQFSPTSHPCIARFQQRVREEEEEEGEEGEEGEGDVVMGQVQRSLICPLTRKFLEDPVTSKDCGHSYSRAAILEHIRKRPAPRCPVCNASVGERSLQKDDRLAREVQRARRKKGKGKQKRGVVSL